MSAFQVEAVKCSPLWINPICVCLEHEEAVKCVRQAKKNMSMGTFSAVIHVLYAKISIKYFRHWLYLWFYVSEWMACKKDPNEQPHFGRRKHPELIENRWADMLLFLDHFFALLFLEMGNAVAPGPIRPIRPWLNNMYYDFFARQELRSPPTHRTFHAVNSGRRICGMSKRITNNFSDKTLAVSVSTVLMWIFFCCLLDALWSVRKLAISLADGRLLRCVGEMAEGCEFEKARRSEKRKEIGKRRRLRR